MHYLYLDSSNGLTLGLLNKDLEWLFFESLNEKKPSEVIHVKINELLEKHQVDIKNLKIISCAGPGSYTGMRLSEGISHIMKICGVETISFFQFEIPQLSGIDKGVWITNAFKKELFVFEWDKNKNSKNLTSIDSIKSYPHFYSNLEEISGIKSETTNELIKNNSQLILKKVLARNTFYEAYYYRTLEEEFKPV